jgi:hypothetical protein
MLKSGSPEGGPPFQFVSGSAAGAPDGMVGDVIASVRQPEVNY